MFKYDVFLSFRGKDVRKHFVDILYEDLVESGLKVFKDNERLVLGNDIQSNLYEAIEQSQLCIVILSSTFEKSSWCLDELVKILECCCCVDQQPAAGHIVLPVFYHVEPTDVRHPNEETLIQLGKKVGQESRVKIWKDALNTISRRVGLSLKDTNRQEGLLVERIIKEARRVIGPSQQVVPINIFRPESFVEQFKLMGGNGWN